MGRVGALLKPGGVGQGGLLGPTLRPQPKPGPPAGNGTMSWACGAHNIAKITVAWVHTRLFEFFRQCGGLYSARNFQAMLRSLS